MNSTQEIFNSYPPQYQLEYQVNMNDLMFQFGRELQYDYQELQDSRVELYERGGIYRVVVNGVDRDYFYYYWNRIHTNSFLLNSVIRTARYEEIREYYEEGRLV